MVAMISCTPNASLWYTLSYVIVGGPYIHPTSTNMIPQMVCLPELEGIFPSVNMALLIVCFAVLKYNILNSRKESMVDTLQK